MTDDERAELVLLREKCLLLDSLVKQQEEVIVQQQKSIDEFVRISLHMNKTVEAHLLATGGR